jgi:CRP-like cAMP-binding protein
MPVIAFLQGALGASSLLLGAGLGVVWQPSRTFSAAIMAFGSGTLLSAISFEITTQVYQKGGFGPLLVGFMVGGSLFTLATQYIDQQGGFLRHPASSRRYLFQQRQEAASEVLDRLAHVEVMRNIPPAELQTLLPFFKLCIVDPGEVLCREGEAGDSLFLILEGQAEVLKGQQPITVLGAGEVFGEMAVLTGEPRSATVVARTPMELYELKRNDFNALLARAPQIAGAMSLVLARRLQSTTESQAQAEQRRDHWRQSVLDSVEIDLPPSEQQALMQQLTTRTAPLAILIGSMIDNIPESAVIGMSAESSHFNGSFLLAVFLSNFPEALSSSMGMKKAGARTERILGLWSGIVVLCGLVAVLGDFLQGSASGLVLLLTQAIAGGAILAMIASTMMPEAYELGGGSINFSTILGFLIGFWVSAPHLQP